MAFLVALVAKITGGVAWSLVRKYWKPLLFGAIGLSIVLTLVVQQRMIRSRDTYIAKAKEVIDEAVKANVASNAAVDTLKAEAAKNTEASAKSIEQSHTVTERHEAAKKEMGSEKGGSDSAGPYFDDLARRLQLLDAQDRGANPR